MGGAEHGPAFLPQAMALEGVTNLNQNEQAQRMVERYADTILRLSYTYLKNTQDAQDICQNVLIKLLLEERAFDSPEHERAWVLRVTANACKDR